MIILVTGCAGFIGSHLCEKLLTLNHDVIGIDNLDNYYNIQQKEDNLTILFKYNNFCFIKDDLSTTDIISKYKFDVVVNLGALAGVRYSLIDPEKYVKVNILGQVHLLQECVKYNVKHFVYASSSSVYGLNTNVPFIETHLIDSPSSPYAASKICGEIYAKLYSQLYDISCIGLRFFTVYGSRGRPDMAPYKFIKAIKNDEKFDKFGNGESKRDYTHVSDIVDGIIGAINNKNNIKCDIYNLGNESIVSLNEFISTCEKVTNKQAIYNQLSEQIGDVPITYANCEKAKKDLDYQPKINLFEGLTDLYNWMLKQDHT